MAQSSPVPPTQTSLRTAEQRRKGWRATVVTGLLHHFSQNPVLVLFLLIGLGMGVGHVTAGLLLRRLQADPELPGTAAVVLDEVHERSLEADLLLTLLLDARALREDLVLVAMSATLDPVRLRRLLGGPGSPAPLVEVPAFQCTTDDCLHRAL